MVYQKDSKTFSISAGYKTGDDRYQYNSISRANQNKSNLWQALAIYQQSWKSTTLTTGLQGQNRKLTSNDRGNHQVAQGALFLLLDQAIGSNFRINPAARLDWNEGSGFELVPQVNVSYAINEFQLRASGGKTIREADFTERYNNYNNPLVTGGRIGNPDLAAERSFSYEAGADYFFNNTLKLSGTYFQRYHEDLIDYVVTPYAQMPRRQNLSPTGSFALAKNIASVKTSGVEVDVQLIKKLSTKSNLQFAAGLLWLTSESDASTPSFYVSSHAKFLGNFNVVYQNSRFRLSTSGLYKVRQPQGAAAIHASITKDYFVLNAKGEAFVWGQKLSLVAQADNLLDRAYSDLLGAPMPGRWLMGGITVKL